MKSKITVFYCVNCFNGLCSLPVTKDIELQFVKLPCSGMLKEVFLLRAFESGADSVIVLGCPEGQCRYTEGNIRAKKRTAQVKNLLNQIGINSNRVSISNVSSDDHNIGEQIIQYKLTDLKKLGHCLSHTELTL